MKNTIIEESLKEEYSFSSNVHGIDTITRDNNTSALVSYPVPQRYYENKLVLLPVNKTRFYFYWEFTQEYLKQNKSDINGITFHIIDQDHKLLEIIDCGFEYGQYFYDQKIDAKSIKVLAVYKNGTIYKVLLESNILKILNDQIKMPKNDVWMVKEKGFTEIIKSSMNRFTIGMSSKNYVDEIQRLKEFEKISKQSYSSSNLGGLK